jgi:eukaryotic-like serine/threonine-protein kinase
VLRDRYRLDALIASGGMGDVWRGTDLAIDRRVAIKLLRPEHADDEDGLARFRAEAHHAGSLSHPNIAQVFDYGEARAAEPGYLVMELVEGLSLTRILDDGPLPPGDVMDVVAQAARGLAAAHQAGLVHRDIKPGNLLVRLDGLVKITDFGIATRAGENPVTQPVTQPGMLIGTPAYLAPERISGVPATPATDLYALGIVAHQCLTGQVPFAGEPLAVALAHLDRGIPPLPPFVPPAVAALVTDLTRQDPAARPGSAWDVAVRAEHLRVILSGPEAPSPGDATTALSTRADGAGQASPAVAGPVRVGSVAGPVAAGAALAGPVAGQVVAGPVVAGPVVAGPVVAGPVVADPVPGAAAGVAPAAPRRPRPRPRPGHRGPRPRRPGPDRNKASLPVRGALVLTGVASVGFISWTLATLPSPASSHTPSVAPPASSQSAAPSLLPRQSPVAAARIAGANGGSADVARASATPQVSQSGRPHRSGSPKPTTPAPTTPVPTTPVPTTPVPTTPVPTTPVPTTPVPTTPVPTTPVPTSPVGSLTPSAPPTAPAIVSAAPAPPSLLTVQIVP